MRGRGEHGAGGTELRGVVKRVHKVGLGLVYESAGLSLEFTLLHLPDGREYTVSVHLAGIDNARERVDRKGNIHGIRATATLSNRLGERILFSALGHHPASMIPLLALESSLFHFPDPEIEFRRGTEIQFDVEFPEELGAVAACPLREVEASPEEWAAMQQVVDALPYWTYSKRQRQPMDLVNLLFVGSQGEVDGLRGGRVDRIAAEFHAGDRGFHPRHRRTAGLFRRTDAHTTAGGTGAGSPAAKESGHIREARPSADLEARLGVGRAAGMGVGCHARLGGDIRNTPVRVHA